MDIFKLLREVRTTQLGEKLARFRERRELLCHLLNKRTALIRQPEGLEPNELTAPNLLTPGRLIDGALEPWTGTETAAIRLTREVNLLEEELSLLDRELKQATASWLAAKRIWVARETFTTGERLIYRERREWEDREPS